MTRAVWAIAMGVLLQAAPSLSGARTWVVAQDGSGDFLLISEAYAAAASGDSVVIQAGEYTEEPYVGCGPSLVTSRKSLTILGATGNPEDVRLMLKHGFFMCPRLAIRHLTFCRVVLALHIGGSYGEDWPEAEISNCIFEDNHKTCPGGPATLCVNHARVLIENCIFRRNSDGTDDNHGVAIDGGYNITVRSCLFEDNVSLGEAGAIEASGDEMLIENCIFVRNKANRGSAIVTSYGTIRNCTFWDNEGPSTVSLFQSGLCFMERCIVAGTRGGYGVEANHSSLQCCDFWQNEWGPCIQCFMDPGNFEADPLLCQPLSGDFGLQVNSPCVDGNLGGWECGLIGARGVGCGSPAVVPLNWGRLKMLYRNTAR